MPLFQIKSRFDASIIFEGEFGSLKLCVEAAVKARANLADADLARADLAHANLAGANLAGANLARADLARADLAHANLAGAKFAGADLARANLAGAKLIGDRPVLVIGPLGSRSAYLTAFLTDQGVRVLTGCFFGSLDEFSGAIAATHGEGIHAREYAAAMAMIEAHASIWTPQEAAKAA